MTPTETAAGFAPRQPFHLTLPPSLRHFTWAGGLPRVMGQVSRRSETPPQFSGSRPPVLSSHQPGRCRRKWLEVGWLPGGDCSRGWAVGLP